MNEQQRYQLIEDYLKNHLSGNDKLEFEKLLKTDAILSKEFQLMKASYSVFTLQESAALKANLKHFSSKRKQRSKIAKTGTALIALLGIGLITSYFLFQNEEKPEKEQKTTTVIITDSNTNKTTTELPVTEQDSPTNQTDTTALIQNKETRASKIEETQVYKPDSISTNAVVKTSPNVDTKEETPSGQKARKDIDSISVAIVENQKQEKNTAENKEKLNCDLLVDVKTTNASALENNGVIELFSASNYLFSINKNQKFSDITYYNNLEPGTYLIIARDGNSCIDTIKTVRIKRDFCVTDYNKVFNANYENEWKIPTSPFKSGEVKILNKSLKEVFSYTFNQGEEVFWNGKTTTGAKSTFGLHKVIITYTDDIKCIHELIIAE